MADSGYVSSPLLGDEVILQYDDTFEGLMTALFVSYEIKPSPIAVVGSQHQQLLGVRYEAVETDEAKAERVIAGIRRTMGNDAYEQIWTAFQSCEPDKGDVIYRYVRLGMKLGRGIALRLTDPRVMALQALSHQVGQEAHQLIQFTRFSKLEGGVYYGRITPENNVVPLMMPFFTDRFHVMPFLLHDAGRDIAGVYDTREWVVASTEEMRLPDTDDDEKYYRSLWKRFYDTVAIRERINPRLRRQHMPHRFWKNMVEMASFSDADGQPLPTAVSRAAVEAGTVTPPLPLDSRAVEAMRPASWAGFPVPSLRGENE